MRQLLVLVHKVSHGVRYGEVTDEVRKRVKVTDDLEPKCNRWIRRVMAKMVKLSEGMYW